jgi:N2-citryl-N6-acetyl-N6-hydroxylysine synthase
LQQRLQRFAAESAPQLLAHFTDDVWLLPMHPWQADHLLTQTWCQELVTQGLLSDLGEAGERWLPTSSSRSLYSASNRDMIKFSLSVRLTNSVRTLSVKEVERGIRLARLAQNATLAATAGTLSHLPRDAGRRLGRAAFCGRDDSGRKPDGTAR